MEHAKHKGMGGQSRKPDLHPQQILLPSAVHLEERLTVSQSLSQAGKQSVRQSVGQAGRQTGRHTS